MNKLAAAYIKCIKIFFGYTKFSSVTVMLLDLGLPCFSTLLPVCVCVYGLLPDSNKDLIWFDTILPSSPDELTAGVA